MYGFVDTISDHYALSLICKTLHLSRSSYYDWKNKKTHQCKDKYDSMKDKIVAVFWQHKRRYGSRRIAAELNHQNVKVSPYKVRKYLSVNGLKAIQPRSFIPKTTDSRHRYAISPNLLKERSFPTTINQVWVGDITYIPMADRSFQYLSVWMDLCSRKIVGWELQNHMRESLVITSFRRAITNRTIKDNLLIHSDRGGQYASKRFRSMLVCPLITQSMSDRKNPYDNAHMESCFSRFKAELMQGEAFRDAEHSRAEIFEFIETYYNRQRLHSSIGYLSPNNFEKSLT